MKAMKSRLSICILLCLFATVALTTSGHCQSLDRFEKNLIGDSMGYGRCPNCGDSWWWKSSDSVWINESRGVLICKECLRFPEKLDENRIVKALLSGRSPWPRDKAELVRTAIVRYKNQHGIKGGNVDNEKCGRSAEGRQEQQVRPARKEAEEFRDKMDYEFGNGKYKGQRRYAQEKGLSGSPRWMELFSKVDMFGKPTVFSPNFMKR